MPASPADAPARETILCAKQNGLLEITLNRPERLNAFNTKMMFELIAAFDEADADDAIRAVILTGQGRAFCAGADLAAGTDTFVWEKRPTATSAKPARNLPMRGDKPDYASEELRDGGGRLALRLFACLKPVIAAVNGAAAGVGATMILPADIRLASQNARFGFVFSRRGLVPEACSSWFLPRIVGISRALEWAYEGALIPAEEARAAGLVRSLHKPEALLDDARELAHKITENGAPVSIALIRQMFWQTLGAAHPMDGHKIESRGIIARGRSADAREGIAAFLEKRPPRFPENVSNGMPDYFPWGKPPSYG